MSRIFRLSVIWLVALWIPGAVDCCDGAANAHPEVIYLQPVLIIGKHAVSFYLLNKYYQRFILTFRSERQRPPNIDETKAWMEHFQAQQIVITEAEFLGFSERPEVKRTVSRMERHMLVRPGGPFFQKFATSRIHSEDELRRIYATSAREIDGLFARFRDEHALEDALDKDFAAQSAEEQTHRVRESRKREDTLVFEGHLGWPYEPFSEIASVLSAAECGRWIRYSDPNCGLYLLLVRAVSMRPQDSFEHSRPAFERIVNDVDANVARKRFRIQQLLQSELALDTAASEQVFHLCRDVPISSANLPEIQNAALAATTFFRYWDGAKTIEVSVDAYRRWLNDKIVRRIPNSATDLRESVEEYVVEELSLRSMRAEGLDTDPQFSEDRRGFTALQALDLYEREVLAPQLKIDKDDIERFYSLHLTEFRRTTRVGGRLLTFDSSKNAAACIQGFMNGDRAIPNRKTAAVSDCYVEITWDHPVRGLEMIQDEIMQSPNGSVLGPLSYGQFYLVFVKVQNMETGVMPLAMVENAIRGRLLREALDAREQELAVEFALRYEVEDHIDYSRFGLRMADVRSPWRRQTSSKLPQNVASP